MDNAVVQKNQPKAQKARFSVAIRTDAYQELITSTLQDPARARKFTAAITSAVAVNPQLQECTAPSILAGALLGESLNLSPSPQLGQYYLVPFKKKQKMEDGSWGETHTANFVLGYRGMIQLAIRSGYYSDIDAMEVREGEYLGLNKSTGKPMFDFVEDDEERERLPVVGYMAYLEYLNGFKKTIYWSKDKVAAHADMYSQAFNLADYDKYQSGQIPQNELWKYSSFWYKNFDMMAKKTLLRQLISKWGVMSIEFQMAIQNDEHTVKMENNIFTPEEPITEYENEVRSNIDGALSANAGETVDIETI